MTWLISLTPVMLMFLLLDKKVHFYSAELISICIGFVALGFSIGLIVQSENMVLSFKPLKLLFGSFISMFIFSLYFTFRANTDSDRILFGPLITLFALVFVAARTASLRNKNLNKNGNQDS